MKETTKTVSQGFALDFAAGWYDLFSLALGERRVWEMTIKLANLRPGARVLDVGCGTGRLALLMKGVVGEEGHVAGIDLAPRTVDRARHQAQKRGLEIDFRGGSIVALPFPDSSFDVVTSSLMAHHLPRTIKQDGFVEVRRVLRPGGCVLLCDIGPPSERWMWMTQLLVLLFHWGGAHPEDNLEWRIPTMLEDAGFVAAGTVAHLDLLAGMFRIHFVRAGVPVRSSKVLKERREGREAGNANSNHWRQHS